ncbi:MAG: subclass B3 metallo-beta-lactamase [Acidobacteriota bacterium]
MTLRTFLGLLACSGVLLAQPSTNPDWHRAFPPFHIAGNLYYVGTADLAAYLIQTVQGNILINSNFDQDVPALKKSIEQLGLKYQNTTYLLISHAHGDHDGGIGTIQRETGAKLMVMAEDSDEVQSTAKGRPGAHVDRVLHDGYTVELGPAKLVAHLTPGHTKGCTTWTMQVADEGRLLNVVIVGSPNVNAGTYLVGNKSYPQIADDYVKTFAVLKGLPCDVFLGAHGAYFGLKAKFEKYKTGDKNAFIDPAGYKTWVDEKEKEFLAEWARQRAHPGTPKI